MPHGTLGDCLSSGSSHFCRNKYKGAIGVECKAREASRNKATLGDVTRDDFHIIMVTLYITGLSCYLSFQSLSLNRTTKIRVSCGPEPFFPSFEYEFRQFQSVLLVVWLVYCIHANSSRLPGSLPFSCMGHQISRIQRNILKI